ncbi:MAG TPA: hypothetical protein VFP36_11960 [Usitatibacter sp.]|nr:hypothetical protein [Usitatibacter sp.]
MNWKLKPAFGAAALLLTSQAFAQITFAPAGPTITVNDAGEPRG